MVSDVNHRTLTTVSKESGDFAPISPANFGTTGDHCTLTTVSKERGDFVPNSPANFSTTGDAAGFATQSQSPSPTAQGGRHPLERGGGRDGDNMKKSGKSAKNTTHQLRWVDIEVIMKPNSEGVHRLSRVFEVFTGVNSIARNTNIRVWKTPEEIEEEITSKTKKMTAEILVGQKIYQRSPASLAVLASTEGIERVHRADLQPVPDLD